MNITYNRYTGKNVKSAAQTVLTNRLFVNKWCMRDDAKQMIEFEEYNDEKQSSSPHTKISPLERVS